jgi:Serine phosphatase RsbU, regulator of sigma subunit
MSRHASQSARIRTACREFTRATGVPLHFESSETAATRFPSNASRIWQSPIQIGNEKGVLHILHQPHQPIDQRLHEACQLADLVAQLLKADAPAESVIPAPHFKPSAIDQRDLARARQLKSELQLISDTFLNRQFQFDSSDSSVTACGRIYCKGEVGGDLCEVVELSGRQTLIALGDATGNGLPAAMILSFVRGALYSQLNGPADKIQLDSIISAINRAFFQLASSYHYMSLFLGILDTRERSLRYINAGHPALILLRNDATCFLTADVPILGVLDDLDPKVQEFPLASGDVIIGLTDGLSEARNSAGEMLGLKAIAQAARETIQSPVDAISKALIARHNMHTSSPQVNDDLSLLVMRINMFNQRGMSAFSS